MDKFYTITELTREFGVSTRTLRFYEDEGLINPERRGRTRLFRPADRRLIQEILRGRRIGFTIAEIRDIIRVYKDPPGEVGQLEMLMNKFQRRIKVWFCPPFNNREAGWCGHTPGKNAECSNCREKLNTHVE